MTQNDDKIVELPSFIDNHKMSWYQIRIVLICGIVMFADGFDTQMIAYVAPFVGREWGLDNETLGALFSASLFGLMIGYLVVAPMADRIGHKRMVLVTVLGTSLAVFVSAAATNAGELMAIRFVTGIGLGAVIPSAIALTSEYTPKRFRATTILAIYVGYSLGFVVSGLVSGWIIPAYGWPAIFIVGGGMSLAIVPAIFFLLPNSLVMEIKKGKNLEGVKNTLRCIDSHLPKDFTIVVEDSNDDKQTHKKVNVTAILAPPLFVGTILLWAVFAVNLGVFYALQSWLPTILDLQGFEMDMMVKGTLISTVGGIVAAIVLGSFMDKKNPYFVLASIYLLGFFCIFLLGLSFQYGHWWLLLSSFLVGFCVNGGQKCVIAISSIFYPYAIRGAGVGWALGIGRIGAIAGPFVVGKYMDLSWSPTTIFGLIAVPMLFLSAAIFFLGKVYGRTTTEVPLKSIR